MAKMSLGFKQTQSLMMTPQLQQAIKLLTLTHLEMTNVIAKEMVENPVLEETESGEATEKKSKNTKTKPKKKRQMIFRSRPCCNKERMILIGISMLKTITSTSSTPP
jgi:DNA-directed RNA polymerase specialized sigma54-like protein